MPSSPDCVVWFDPEGHISESSVSSASERRVGCGERVELVRRRCEIFEGAWSIVVVREIGGLDTGDVPVFGLGDLF